VRGVDYYTDTDIDVMAGAYLTAESGVLSVDREALLGDVDTALDAILAMQQSYLGGADA
jgi:hypothetical protein